MDKLEILDMKAGRELDIAIGKEIFGGEVQFLSPKSRAVARLNLGDGSTQPLPHYSTNWFDLKELLERMVKDGFSLELIVGADGYTLAKFWRSVEEATLKEGEVLSDSVPEAICKAALLAKI